MTTLEALKKYGKHLPTCNIEQDWTEAYDAFANTPQHLRDHDYDIAFNEMQEKQKTCTCGLNETILSTEVGHEKATDGLHILMALVRAGYAHAAIDLADFCKNKDIPNDLVDEIINMLNSDNKKKFVYEYFKKELDEVNEENKSIIAYITNLEDSSFEGWNPDEIKGYKTALISIGEYYKKLPSRIKESPAPKTPEIGHVWKKKEGYKFVVRQRNLREMAINPEQFEFICSRPHEDQDFSYLCGQDWCRCCQ